MLSVNGIDVSYGYAKVLHDVSLKVEKGQFVFVAGRNGAGKTTLLKTICGLMSPSKGTIIFEGEDIQNKSPVLLAQQGIRYVCQDKKVFDLLTVKENLELATFAVKENLSKTIQMAIDVYPQFEKLLNHKAGRLSGGQKEILLILRALVGKPKLLLIDEPTEGLATIVINDIIKLLNMMKGEVSAIIVEQKLNIVSELADSVYPMKEGKISKGITSREEINDIDALEACL